jgi:hypothetical protein
VAFVMLGLEVHPIFILFSFALDQRPSSHFSFPLHVGCSKYKHSKNHDPIA